MFAAIAQFFNTIRIFLESFENVAISTRNLTSIGVHMSEDYANEANIKRQANLALMLKDNSVTSIES